MHINEISLSPAHFCILIRWNKPLPFMHINKMKQAPPIYAY